MSSQNLTGHIHYETELNASQMEAVTIPGGPILVIAGAGSGKTRTIVYRVAWLVEQGIDPASILLLTFTRKAAEEMLSRAADLLDDRVHQVAGGTFHSTGNLLLRRYGHVLGYDSSFSIMDQGDSLEAVEHIRKSLDPPIADLKAFPKGRTIAELISRAVNTGDPVETVLERRYPHLEEYGADVEKIAHLYGEYKRDNNLVDYDDLLVNSVRILEEHDDIRAELSARWQHILVDEYQDTNQLQAAMVQLLATSHDNVLVVGDDSQSIYSFRGADFRNIMEFPTLFPGTRVIKLEENFRSTAHILAVTNSIISLAQTGYPKRLFTRKTDGTAPLVARPYSERDQSRFVMQCIEELDNAGISLSEVAVLFRASFDSFDLEGELTRNGVGYVKYGGFKFLESLHIKDVLAHLKVLNNKTDRLSWVRVLKLLPGIGVQTSLKLAARISEEGIPEDPSTFVPKGRKQSEPFHRLIELISRLKNSTDSLAAKVEEVNLYYFPFLQQNYDNYPKRMRDLERLADLTVSYKSLNRFLNDMALDPPDGDAAAEKPKKDSLVLSTIHSSKGLEWHTVILLWAVEGRIPSPMAQDSLEDQEEERRLLYVATTRAKHNLVVVAPRMLVDRRKGHFSTQISRFFDAVPSEYFRTYAGLP
jgi:ATP-dependent DNA helicase UvrD/PcrA